MSPQPFSKSSRMVSLQLELGDSQMLPSNGAPPESSLPPEAVVGEALPFRPCRDVSGRHERNVTTLPAREGEPSRTVGVTSL